MPTRSGKEYKYKQSVLHFEFDLEKTYSYGLLKYLKKNIFVTKNILNNKKHIFVFYHLDILNQKILIMII